MSSEINFSGQYKFTVQVEHDELGELGEATLQFGGDQWPSLRFDNWLVPSKFEKNKKYNHIRAATKSGEIFTLFDCTVAETSIWIDCIVAGAAERKFQKIKIRFDDINGWYMPFRTAEEIINPKIPKTDRNKQISVTAKSGGQSFEMSTERVTSTSHVGEDHIIHEHILFSFKRLDGLFRVKDIKEKAHELSSLLSILFAVPLYILNALVTCDDGRTHYAFFPATIKKQQATKTRSWVDYFISKPRIDGRWQEIFENYYKSKYRKILWAKLAGMQHYDSFWDFNALGYVALLDKYISERADGKKRKPLESELSKDKKLHKAFQEIVPKLSAKQMESVFSIIEKFFMRGRELSFREKYEYVSDTMNLNVRSIINLTNDDFDVVKKIRDAVAHGNAPKVAEADFSRISLVVHKITLVLTYWAFIDFGLTDEDFINCLGGHCWLPLSAGIDKIYLARLTGTAGFFQVSKKQFDELSQTKGIKHNACFLKRSDGRIEYAAQHTLAFKAYMVKPKSGEIPVAEIFGQSKDKIKCWGQAYLESEQERLELFMAYFIEIT